MIKILIVDDHAVVRIGIRQFLADTDEAVITQEAATGEEGIAYALGDNFDVVVLDLTLPDISGLDVLKKIRAKKPKLPILIFSMLPEEDFTFPSLAAGASGYLSKDSPPDRILLAIRTVAAGMRYLSPFLTEKLLSGAIVMPDPMLHERLSHREMETLLLLSKGMSLTRIGVQLSLSVKTISTYRKRLLEKLALKSNAEITRYVIKYKLG